MRRLGVLLSSRGNLTSCSTQNRSCKRHGLEAATLGHHDLATALPAPLAQWQSICMVSRRPRVQFPGGAQLSVLWEATPPEPNAGGDEQSVGKRPRLAIGNLWMRCSGRMPRCHRGRAGSIPVIRTLQSGGIQEVGVAPRPGRTPLGDERAASAFGSVCQSPSVKRHKLIRTSAPLKRARYEVRFLGGAL